MIKPLRLFNTLSRKVETFQPFDAEKVKIYTCGPTVYSSPHIGNLTAYIYWDLLIRTLKANHYRPYRVLNLTDVGHLTSDGDEGEDKLEKGARQTSQTVWEVAEHYIAEFKDSFTKLHLTPPEVWARATDYIAEDIAIIDLLTERGYTYETSDGIYFDTSKFPHYANFARLDLAGLKAGARVEFSAEKHNPSDFAVWKFIQPGENHAMRWDYLGRPGYPGWHLECSTIIHTELGETIDIHTGGIDHIPVHHTNEIAQSEAAFDRQLAKFWLHCNHLTSNGQKLSKSLGNGYTLRDLAERNFSPLDFKMWALQGHYQSTRNFDWDDLAAAKKRRLNWRNRLAKAYQGFASDDQFGCEVSNKLSSEADGNFGGKSDSESGDKIDREFDQTKVEIIFALNDNLNSPAAFSIIDSSSLNTLEFWQFVDQIFGLGIIEDAKLPNEEQAALLKQRIAARNERDYQRSDELRTALEATGLTVLDSPAGQIWQYLS